MESLLLNPDFSSDDSDNDEALEEVSAGTVPTAAAAAAVAAAAAAAATAKSPAPSAAAAPPPAAATTGTATTAASSCPVSHPAPSSRPPYAPGPSSSVQPPAGAPAPRPAVLAPGPSAANASPGSSRSSIASAPSAPSGSMSQSELSARLKSLYSPAARAAAGASGASSSTTAAAAPSPVGKSGVGSAVPSLGSPSSSATSSAQSTIGRSASQHYGMGLAAPSTTPGSASQRQHLQQHQYQHLRSTAPPAAAAPVPSASVSSMPDPFEPTPIQSMFQRNQKRQQTVAAARASHGGGVSAAGPQHGAAPVSAAASSAPGSALPSYTSAPGPASAALQRGIHASSSTPGTHPDMSPSSITTNLHAASASMSSPGGSMSTSTPSSTGTTAKTPITPEQHRALLERQAKQKKERFLMFTRVLMKYLEQKDPTMHSRAKAVIKECAEKNKNKEPGYHSLTASMSTRLRATVGDLYWRKAEDYLTHFLKQKLQQQQAAKTKAAPAAAAASATESTPGAHTPTPAPGVVAAPTAPVPSPAAPVASTLPPSASVPAPLHGPAPAAPASSTTPASLASSKDASSAVTQPPPGPTLEAGLTPAQISDHEREAARLKVDEALEEAQKLREHQRLQQQLAKAERSKVLAAEKAKKRGQQNENRKKKAASGKALHAQLKAKEAAAKLAALQGTGTTTPSAPIVGMDGTPVMPGGSTAAASAAAVAMKTSPSLTKLDSLGSPSEASKASTSTTTTTPTSSGGKRKKTDKKPGGKTGPSAAAAAAAATAAATSSTLSSQQKQKALLSTETTRQSPPSPPPREYSELMEMVDHAVSYDWTSAAVLLGRDYKNEVNLTEEQRKLLYGDSVIRPGVASTHSPPFRPSGPAAHGGTNVPPGSGYAGAMRNLPIGVGIGGGAAGRGFPFGTGASGRGPLQPGQPHHQSQFQQQMQRMPPWSSSTSTLPPALRGWGKRNVVSARVAWAKIRLAEQERERDQALGWGATRGGLPAVGGFTLPPVPSSRNSAIGSGVFSSSSNRPNTPSTSAPAPAPAPAGGVRPPPTSGSNAIGGMTSANPNTSNSNPSSQTSWFNEEKAEEDRTLALVSEATEIYLRSILEGAITAARERQNIDGIRLWHRQHGPTRPPLSLRLGCDVKRQVALSHGNAAKTCQRMEEALERQIGSKSGVRNRLDDEGTLFASTSMSDLAKKPKLASAATKADYDAKRSFEVFGGKGSGAPPFGRVPKKSKIMVQDFRLCLEDPSFPHRRRGVVATAFM